MITQQDVEYVAKAIDAWIASKDNDGRLTGAYVIPRTRFLNIFDEAQNQLSKWYSYLKSPSPLKKAAAICYGIARAIPLFPKALVATVGRVPDSPHALLRMCALECAELGIDIARLYVSDSKFDIPGLDEASRCPPFNLRYPSVHFKNEVRISLAVIDDREDGRRDELTPAGIAFILEMMLFNDTRGRNLFGRLGKPGI